MHDAIMFPSILKALNIPPGARISLIARLDFQAMEGSIDNIRRVSIELMGMYREVIGRGGSPNGSFLTAEKAANDEEQDIVNRVLSVARAKKKGRRPRMEVSSVRKAASINNFPNNTYGAEGLTAKGMRCFRCGAQGHMLKSCPRPFAPKPAFAPIGKGAGEGPIAKSVHFSMENIEVVGEADQPEQYPVTGIGDAQTEQFREEPIETLDSKNESGITDEEWARQWITETIMYSETDLTWRNRGNEMSDYEVLPDCEDIFVASTQTFDHGAVAESERHIETWNAGVSHTPELILDSGASTTVTGIGWVREWTKQLHPIVEMAIVPSKRIFKFGDSKTFGSRGATTLSGRITVLRNGIERNAELDIEVDLVGARIPLLVSRRSLQKMGESLNFEKNAMELPESRLAQLAELKSGHFPSKWKPKGDEAGLKNTVQRPVYVCNEQILGSETPDVQKGIGEPMFWKIHHRIAHCSIATIEQLGKTAWYHFDTTKGKEWMGKCPRKRDDQIPQTPTISKHVADTPGTTIFVDLRYPVRRIRNRIMHSLLFALWPGMFPASSCGILLQDAL